LKTSSVYTHHPFAAVNAYPSLVNATSKQIKSSDFYVL